MSWRHLAATTFSTTCHFVDAFLVDAFFEAIRRSSSEPRGGLRADARPAQRLDRHVDVRHRHRHPVDHDLDVARTRQNVDTGVGIAEEDRDIIFEKFRQSSTVAGNDRLTREYSGTGLGLSITYGIIQKLGGDIKVESQLGTGTTFTIAPLSSFTCSRSLHRGD